MHFIFWQISAFEEPLKHAPLVMLDANITQEAIDHACSFCAANHIPGKKSSISLDSSTFSSACSNARYYS